MFLFLAGQDALHRELNLAADLWASRQETEHLREDLNDVLVVFVAVHAILPYGCFRQQRQASRTEDIKHSQHHPANIRPL